MSAAPQCLDFEQQQQQQQGVTLPRWLQATVAECLRRWEHPKILSGAKGNSVVHSCPSAHQVAPRRGHHLSAAAQFRQNLPTHISWTQTCCFFQDFQYLPLVTCIMRSVCLCVCVFSSPALLFPDTGLKFVRNHAWLSGVEQFWIHVIFNSGHCASFLSDNFSDSQMFLALIFAGKPRWISDELVPLP